MKLTQLSSRAAKLTVAGGAFLLSACSALILLTAVRHSAAAQGMMSAGTIASIPAGTVLPVRLNDDLSSDHSRPGDRFSASVASDKHGYSSFRGVSVEGMVVGASPKDGNKPGTIRLTFDKVRGPHGKAIKFDGVAAPLNGDNFNLDTVPYRLKNMSIDSRFVGSTYKPAGGRKGHDVLLKRGDVIGVVAR